MREKTTLYSIKKDAIFFINEEDLLKYRRISEFCSNDSYVLVQCADMRISSLPVQAEVWKEVPIPQVKIIIARNGNGWAVGSKVRVETTGEVVESGEKQFIIISNNALSLNRVRY